MSADDFQTKYASVMDGMLKAAIAETTKLFETMVDELKSEISRIKSENEDLKTRCRLFETESSKQRGAGTGPSDLLQKRDTAVQCDLGPVRMMVVEQPFRQNQKKHPNHEGNERAFQEHNYTCRARSSPTTYLLVRQESAMNQEGQSPVVCGHPLSYNNDSPLDSASATEDKGSLTDQAYSAGQKSSVKRHDETQALDQPPLRPNRDSQGPQKQSFEVEPSLVISVAATKDGISEECVASQTVLDTGTQGVSITSENHLMLYQIKSEIAQKEHASVLRLQCQTEGKIAEGEQMDILQQCVGAKSTQEPTALNRDACDAAKRGTGEVEATSQSNLPSKRGQKPRKAKRLQQLVAGIPKNLARIERNVKKSPAGRVRDVEMSYVGDTVTDSVDQKESASTATVQETADSLLENVEHRNVNSQLVSAPTFSSESSSEFPLSMDSEKRVIQVPITEGSSANGMDVTPPAESLQTPVVKRRERQSSVTLQDAMLLVDLSMAKDTCSSAQKVTMAPQTQCADIAGALQTLDEVPAESQTHLPTGEKGNFPECPIVTQSVKETTDPTPTNEARAHIEAVKKKQRMIPLSNASTSSVPPSLTAAQKSVLSLLHHHPYLLKTAVVPSREERTELQKIVVVPRPTSLVPHTTAGPPPSHSVVSLVLAAQKSNLIPRTGAVGVSQGAPSVSSLPQKKNYVASNKPTLQTKKMVVVPRPEPAVSSRKQVTAQPVSAKSAVSLSPSQVTSVSVQTQTTITSHKRKPLPKVESPKRTVSDAEKTDAETEVCSSFNMSGASVQNDIPTDQDISSKTPPSAPTEQSILIIRVPPDGSCDPIHVLKEESTQEESSVGTSETPVSSSLTEPAVAADTSEIQEKVSSESCSTLEPSPQGTHVQPFLSPVVLLQVTNTDPPFVPPKDCSDPHSQMTKCQFLAHLSVTPVTMDLNEASSHQTGDAGTSCAELPTNDKNGSEKKRSTAQSRCRIKSHLRRRRSKADPHPDSAIQVCPASPKRARLENDYLSDKNATSDSNPLRPQNREACEGAKSLKKTPNDITPNSPENSEHCKGVDKPKMSSNETSSIISKRPKSSSVSTPVTSRRSDSGGGGTGFKNSPKESPANKESEKSSVRPRRTSSTRYAVNPKDAKTLRSHSNTKTTSETQKRTSVSRDGGYPKRTESDSVGPKTSDGASVRKKGRTDSQRVRWPELSEDGISLRKTRESTSVKKLRPIQTPASPEKTIKAVTPKKFAKAAKAPTVAKMKKSKQSKLPNGSKARLVTESGTSCETSKKRTAKAVWSPPRIPATKTSPAGGKQLPVKKETRSQDRAVASSPSISQDPIPANAPPDVTTLVQPLSVIGKRLLKNQCGECGRILSSKTALESHVMLHKDRRPFSCLQCGKRFPDTKGLNRHGRVHRNGPIYVCPKCGKGFVYSFCVTKHIQMVHRKLKPYVCQICKKGFFTKRDMEAHVRIHTGEKPFQCNLCEKKFTRRVDLNVHLRWHNGEKRHWCSHCGKGFLDLNNLKRHTYTHTGEKPHTCPHCSKKFTQSAHLKKHVRNVHKIQ